MVTVPATKLSRHHARVPAEPRIGDPVSAARAGEVDKAGSNRSVRASTARQPSVGVRLVPARPAEGRAEPGTTAVERTPPSAVDTAGHAADPGCRALAL
jgi:hypothetical protein